MILNLKRYISLRLVLMLLIGIVPTVNAAELDSESTLPEETVSEATEQTEPTEPTELTESTDNSEPTDPTEPTEPTEAPNEDPGEDDMELLAEADNAIMLAASTTSNVLLFDQASPNYTTYLSSQISVTYGDIISQMGNGSSMPEVRPPRRELCLPMAFASAGA